MSEASKFSAPFVHMASRIDRNEEKDFAGAVLIVPPSGEPLEIMSLDPKQDVAAFWGMVKARVTVAAEMAVQAADQGQHGGFGAQGRRR